MDQLAIARRAIEEEISALSAEVERLHKVLGHLGVTTSIAPYSKTTMSAPAAKASASAAAPAKRGRPKGVKSAAKATPASSSDISAALEFVKSAGKKGIKALSLASLIKKAGGSRPSKEELLATDKVKMTGRGGGTTYTFVG